MAGTQRGEDQLVVQDIVSKQLKVSTSPEPAWIVNGIGRWFVCFVEQVDELPVFEAHHRSVLSVNASKPLPHPAYRRHPASEPSVHRIDPILRASSENHDTSDTDNLRPSTFDS